MFKPGDKIIYVGDELNEYVTHGKIYIVDVPCHHAFNDPNWICILRDDKGSHQGFSINYYKFELYNGIFKPRNELELLDKIQYNFR